MPFRGERQRRQLDWGYGQRRFRPWRGKGWGEPKNPIEPRFGCLDLEVPNTFYLPPFGGADLVIGRLHRLVAKKCRQLSYTCDLGENDSLYRCLFLVPKYISAQGDGGGFSCPFIGGKVVNTCPHLFFLARRVGNRWRLPRALRRIL